jgi:MFS family permease
MKRTLQDRRPSVWRHRDLRLAGPSQALTFLAGEIVLVVLILQAFAAGWGTTGTAAVLAVAALPLALGTVLAGPVVDRVSSRRLSVAAAAWQALVCLAMAASQLVDLPAVLLLVGLLLLQLGQAVAGPTWSALLPQLVEREELPAAVGSVQALTMLLGLLGPVVAGVALGLGGVEVALLLAAAVFAAVAVLASQVRTHRRGTAADGVEAPRMLDGLRFLRGEPVLSVLTTGFVAFVLAVEVTGVVLVFLARGDLGASEVAYGVLGSVIALGLVVGNLIGGRVPAGHRMVRAAALGAVGMSVALVAVGLAPAVWLLGIALLALGVFNGVVNTAAQTTMAVRIPVERRGRVLAAVSGLLRTASVIGLVAGGAVGALLEPRVIVVGSGVLGLMVGLWLCLRLWRERVGTPGPATATAIVPAAERAQAVQPA